MSLVMRRRFRAVTSMEHHFGHVLVVSCYMLSYAHVTRIFRLKTCYSRKTLPNFISHLRTTNYLKHIKRPFNDMTISKTITFELSSDIYLFLVWLGLFGSFRASLWHWYIPNINFATSSCIQEFFSFEKHNISLKHRNDFSLHLVSLLSLDH